jgi:hypothetical protein
VHHQLTKGNLAVAPRLRRVLVFPPLLLEHSTSISSVPLFRWSYLTDCVETIKSPIYFLKHKIPNFEYSNFRFISNMGLNSIVIKELIIGIFYLVLMFSFRYFMAIVDLPIYLF